MRFLLVALALVVALVYFTIGLRFGYVTLTPTRMWNAQGENNYVFRVFDRGQMIGVSGSCQTTSGRAVIRLYDPKGTQIAGQTCPKGQWALNVVGSGEPGNYRLRLQLERFSGTLDLKETRASP